MSRTGAWAYSGYGVLLAETYKFLQWVKQQLPGKDRTGRFPRATS